MLPRCSVALDLRGKVTTSLFRTCHAVAARAIARLKCPNLRSACSSTGADLSLLGDLHALSAILCRGSFKLLVQRKLIRQRIAQLRIIVDNEI